MWWWQLPSPALAALAFGRSIEGLYEIDSSAPAMMLR
jgi:hypothetical protein